jgi:hypothetical protein
MSTSRINFARQLTDEVFGKLSWKDLLAPKTWQQLPRLVQLKFIQILIRVLQK